MTKEEKIQIALGTLPLWYFNLTVRRENTKLSGKVQIEALNLKDAKYKLFLKLKPWSIDWTTVRCIKHV